MSCPRRLATRTGLILGTICALVLAVLPGYASDRRAFTEEFHQTYPLAAGGRVELDNINGSVHITAWDRNEVKVDAVKYAGTKDRLDEAKIEVEHGSDYVSIRTHYPDHDHNFNGGWNDPAGVEYTLSVPRNVRLDEIKLINGSLDIHGVAAEVRASCINGHLVAEGLQGRAKLETINGHLEARFDHLANSPIELDSVNGSIDLTLPSDVKAELEASTVSGGIEDDFGLHVRHHHFVGHDMRGELGGGGTRIHLSNVNGRIEIHHANDGHTMSSVKDLTHEDRDDDRDNDDGDDI
jgi:Putative adhesin